MASEVLGAIVSIKWRLRHIFLIVWIIFIEWSTAIATETERIFGVVFGLRFLFANFIAILIILNLLNFAAFSVWVTRERTMGFLALEISFAGVVSFDKVVAVFVEFTSISIWMTYSEEIFGYFGTLECSFGIFVVCFTVVIDGATINLFSCLEALVSLIIEIEVPP